MKAQQKIAATETLHQRQAMSALEPVQREGQIIRDSPQVAQLNAYAAIANGAAVTQRQSISQGGLPGNLKSGIESLSGMAMDDVRVHYNSSKPAQLQAHAFAQGSDIHIAAGQERHLPHEAWHVVQQKQGRVKPTLQLKGIAINDDSALEREADTMGAKALGNNGSPNLYNAHATAVPHMQTGPSLAPVQRMLVGKGQENIWSTEIGARLYAERRRVDAAPLGRVMSLSSIVHRLHSIQETIVVAGYDDLVRRIMLGEFNAAILQSLAESPADAKYDLPNADAQDPIAADDAHENAHHEASGSSASSSGATTLTVEDMQRLTELVGVAAEADMGENPWIPFMETAVTANEMSSGDAQYSAFMIRKMYALHMLGILLGESFQHMDLISRLQLTPAASIALMAPALADLVRAKIKITVNALEVGGDFKTWRNEGDMCTYLGSSFAVFGNVFESIGSRAGQLRLLKTLRSGDANIEKFMTLMQNLQMAALMAGGGLAGELGVLLAGNATASGGNGSSLVLVAQSFLAEEFLKSRYTTAQIISLEYNETYQAFMQWLRAQGITFTVIRDAIRSAARGKVAPIETSEVQTGWGNLGGGDMTDFSADLLAILD